MVAHPFSPYFTRTLDVAELGMPRQHDAFMFCAAAKVHFAVLLQKVHATCIIGVPLSPGLFRVAYGLLFYVYMRTVSTRYVFQIYNTLHLAHKGGGGKS